MGGWLERWSAWRAANGAAMDAERSAGMNATLRALAQQPLSGEERAALVNTPAAWLMTEPFRAGKARAVRAPAAATALDLSPEARAARAAEQGFAETPFYHATSSDFPAFNLKAAGTGANAGNVEKAVFLTDNPAVAETYLGGVFVRKDSPDALAHGVEDLGGGVGRTYGPGSQIMPLRLRGLDDFEVYDMGGGGYTPAEMRQMLRDARKAKAPGVVFENMRDPGLMSLGRPKASTVVAVLDPRRIRSPHAAFDPARAHEPDLLAAQAPVSLPIGAPPDEGEARQRDAVLMRMLMQSPP